MKSVGTIEALRAQVHAWHGSRIALVPTMGNLHAGHLSLLEAAQSRAEHTIVSIFVNPLQFGPQEDFARYPRTLERDTQLLEQGGCELLFAPGVAWALGAARWPIPSRALRGCRDRGGEAAHPRPPEHRRLR
jgi:pantoate--beta-alanine ligase